MSAVLEHSSPEYMRWIRTMKPVVSLEERFWAKVEPEPNSGCWIFVGGWTTAGYGSIGRGCRGEGNVYAHRFAYELLRGPIPPDLVPDHLCRVRCCVNPWHLELVTNLENLNRGRRWHQENDRPAPADDPKPDPWLPPDPEEC